jgi:hypothetical protein
VVPAANVSATPATGASTQVGAVPPKRAVLKNANVRPVEEPEILDVLPAAQPAVPLKSYPAPSDDMLDVLPVESDDMLDVLPVEPEVRRARAQAGEAANASDQTYVGWADFRPMRLPKYHVQNVRKRFLRDGEQLLAIVKGRAKAHATRRDGFFNITDHETDKGGRFMYHFLIVTDRRVILWAQGVFKSATDSFDYSDITGVEQQRGMLFGSVVLMVHGNKVNFTEMHKDEAVLIADLIGQQKRTAKDGYQAGASRLENDPATQLEKLAGLLEKGLITHDEFEKKKRKLLDQI